MNTGKQKNTRLRQVGTMLLAFVLVLGLSAAPVQASGLSDVAPAGKKEVSIKQKSKKIVLKNTKGKNKSEVAALKKMLKNNSFLIDNPNIVSFYSDLNNKEYYKWTEDGRLKYCALDILSGVVSMKAFKKLEVLDCKECQCGDRLIRLDLSQNKELKKVHCEYNALANLNVSGCQKLEELYCRGNKLKSLDVSGCPELRKLDCGYNKLASLNVSGCPELWYLDCSENKLKSLDVSGCPKLKKLYCQENKLTSLDLSNNKILDYDGYDDFDCDEDVEIICPQ